MRGSHKQDDDDDTALGLVVVAFVRSVHQQCDQIGRFSEILSSKFAYKSSPNILVNFWAVKNNATFM